MVLPAALAKPYTVVITREIANKYFGKEDPVGKAIRVNNDTALYTITGIIDKVPGRNLLQMILFNFSFLMKNSAKLL